MALGRVVHETFLRHLDGSMKWAGECVPGAQRNVLNWRRGPQSQDPTGHMGGVRHVGRARQTPYGTRLLSSLHCAPGRGAVTTQTGG